MSSPKCRRGHRSLPRRHPVVVAAQRVDFAVVRDHAVRVSQRPGRERVGREPLMHKCKRALEIRIVQVRIIGAELVGKEHALVDYSAARDRHRVVARSAAARGGRKVSARSSCAECRAAVRTRFPTGIPEPRARNTCLLHRLRRFDRIHREWSCRSERRASRAASCLPARQPRRKSP